MYICSSLQNDVCIEWVEHVPFFALSIADGLKIGGSFLILTATAYGIREIANLILNRR